MHPAPNRPPSHLKSVDEQTSSRFSRVLAAKEEFVAGMLGGNEDVGHMRQMLDHEI